jgi:hypothetical protein
MGGIPREDDAALCHARHLAQAAWMISPMMNTQESHRGIEFAVTEGENARTTGIFDVRWRIMVRDGSTAITVRSWGS